MTLKHLYEEKTHIDEFREPHQDVKANHNQEVTWRREARNNVKTDEDICVETVEVA